MSLAEDWSLEGQRAHYAAVRKRLGTQPVALIRPTARARPISRYEVPIGPPAPAHPRGVILYAEPIAPTVPKRDFLRVMSPSSVPRPPGERTRNIILDVLARHPDVSWREIISPRRHANVALVRQIICWRLYNETSLSLPQVAKIVGKTDHSTAWHAVKKIAHMVESGTLTMEQTGGAKDED
jgi:hypothetical protein